MSTPAPTDPFEAALAALLVPLARAMLANGVTLGTANEALKQALLTAADRESEAPLSDSRISLMTGLHRKDVKRLRSSSLDTPHRRRSSAAAQVISHWATSPDYQAADGTPRDLPRKSNGDHPGFDELIRRAHIDMAPGTVLRTLMDQGIVAETADGDYRLLTHAFLPAAGTQEQVAAYQATLSAHLEAATQNLIAKAGEARNFDRAVRYSHLSETSIADLEASASAMAQEMLQTINAQARAAQEADSSATHQGRFVVGSYILGTPGPGKKE
ncbi:hypothetical protein TRL7639_01240 [Falsiruegeria litorea R37]|uniref:Uncharacterized protein n=1 Tax=Falsiruegeria litorea R37 TaxID=1200284 RepID=A0A1Y5S1B3_9RHOB|nr:DUF6502 family protein [Falsiruegeria litorea]SLN30219.1 hypothetical protein TRL7639_01240 [Falsiruegeria litorea R37]